MTTQILFSSIIASQSQAKEAKFPFIYYGTEFNGVPTFFYGRRQWAGAISVDETNVYDMLSKAMKPSKSYTREVTPSYLVEFKKLLNRVEEELTQTEEIYNQEALLLLMDYVDDFAVNVEGESNIILPKDLIDYALYLFTLVSLSETELLIVDWLLAKRPNDTLLLASIIKSIVKPSTIVTVTDDTITVEEGEHYLIRKKVVTSPDSFNPLLVEGM